MTMTLTASEFVPGTVFVSGTGVSMIISVVKNPDDDFLEYVEMCVARDHEVQVHRGMTLGRYAYSWRFILQP
jgi:hypothetical protein